MIERKPSLVADTRNTLRSIYRYGAYAGQQFTLAQVMTYARSMQEHFPPYKSATAMGGAIRKMVQLERQRANLVFEGKGLYRYTIKVAKSKARNARGRVKALRAKLSELTSIQTDATGAA